MRREEAAVVETRRWQEREDAKLIRGVEARKEAAIQAEREKDRSESQRRHEERLELDRDEARQRHKQMMLLISTMQSKK